MSSRINEWADTVVGEEQDTLVRCHKLLVWMFTEFEWSATDYQRRTLEEILERRKGNCAEQTRLLASLLAAVQIQTRQIAEINIQQPRVERGQFAVQMVAEQGPSASVFGYMHNDHRWLEAYDASSGSWFPVDPTTGVCGEQEWVAARMGFGPRPEPAKDMIVPIMIFVVDGMNRVREDRTDHYVISLFG